MERIVDMKMKMPSTPASPRRAPFGAGAAAAAVAAVLAASLAAGAVPAACGQAHAAETRMYLVQVDNPFQVGEAGSASAGAFQEFVLQGSISGGIGEVSYSWLVSTDGGATWVEPGSIEGLMLHWDEGSQRLTASGPAGEYLFKLIAVDSKGNSASQVFKVSIVGDGPVSAAVSAVKTGDAAPIAAAAALAGVGAAGVAVAARASRKKRMEEEDGE